MSEQFIELRYSKDGGNTWSDWKQRSLGDTGDFNRPAIWRRLGIARGWVFHVRMTNPRTLLASSLQAEEGGQ